MSLPTPRVTYYESTNYEDILRAVTIYSNQLIDELGYYPVSIQMNILSQMEIYS
jgi:hypothetical protein